MKTLLSLAGLAALSALGSADLVVDSNLGTLAPGNYSYSGTTVGAPNNASYYAPIANPARNWDGERVYQFTITTPRVISLTSPDTVDHDFFLLNSLATSVDSAGKTYATDINGEFVDSAGTFGLYLPGTYFLSVDRYRGADNVPPVAGGAFDFDLTLDAVVTPSSIASQIGGSTTLSLAAGQVSFLSFDYNGGAFSIDTLGSTISDDDTELGLYDSNGFLVAFNDDIDYPDNAFSELTFADGDLAAGRYYLAVGAYDTTFAPGFDATSSSTSTGLVQINGLSAVPEPSAFAALGLGAAVMLRRRKRA